MLDDIIGLLAPHYCYSCGKIGSGLCSYCKYDIGNEGFSQCVVCLAPTSSMSLCSNHTLPYQRAWVVGERHDVLDTVLDRYKFAHEQGLHRQLASLLDMVVPDLPTNTIVTGIPTIHRHIRQRGFDHIAKIAKEFATMRGLKYEQPLTRLTTTTQFGASKRVRDEQASKAFAVNQQITNDRPYVLIDDVFTTGATMKYAAQALRDGGAQEVWLGLICRQPLDH